nr:hypothetical protein SEVIR_2G344200v2 [Setaria viridis]
MAPSLCRCEEDGGASTRAHIGFNSASAVPDHLMETKKRCIFGTHHRPGTPPAKGITLSGLLNFIDRLWSTCGQKRIIVFTTNYKDRLDPALLRPGHVYTGYCGWEAVKTLARNYFLVDDHALFPEIQELLAEVEVTLAQVPEMMLRSENADVALQGHHELPPGQEGEEQARRKTPREKVAN